MEAAAPAAAAAAVDPHRSGVADHAATAVHGVRPADVRGTGHGLRTRPGQHQLPVGATNRIALEELLHRARFFDLPPRLPLVEVVPGDVLQEITVGNNDVTRTVVYEREGARRPKELDEIVSLLERLAGWQTDPAVQVAPAEGGAGALDADRYRPTAGRGAVRPTEAYPPPVPAGVGAPTGSASIRGPPDRFPPPTGRTAARR